MSSNIKSLQDIRKEANRKVTQSSKMDTLRLSELEEDIHRLVTEVIDLSGQVTALRITLKKTLKLLKKREIDHEADDT